MANKVVICGIDTSTLPKCNNQKLTELMLKIKQGDKVAREEFVIYNLRLVLSIVQRFSPNKNNSDDIFQVGIIGLIKSIDNFDVSVGVKFSTYAVPMIIGEIKRFLRSKNSMRVSRSIRDTAYKVLQARSQIESEIKENSENIRKLEQLLLKYEDQSERKELAKKQKEKPTISRQFELDEIRNVLANFDKLSPSDCNYILAFMSGVIYATEGEVVPVGDRLYLFILFATSSIISDKSYNSLIISISIPL